MQIGEKIKTVREVKKLSQEDMAHHLGMSPNGYAKLERGESRLYMKKLEEIAKILEIDILDLLAITPQSVVIIGERGVLNNTHGTNQYYDNDVNKDELLKAKDVIIEQQKQQIELLREMVQMLKGNSDNS